MLVIVFPPNSDSPKRTLLLFRRELPVDCEIPFLAPVTAR